MNVYKSIRKDIIRICAIVVLMQIGYQFTNIGRDATDSATERSGLKLRVDHGTGLHYLESTGGHLIPRLDQDGNHVHQAQQARQDLIVHDSQPPLRR